MSNYGMYSHNGELEINMLVKTAREEMWDWVRVQYELETLADNLDYSEAYDTVVRENVYKALGFTTPFYI